MKITKLYLIIVSLVALLAGNAIAAAWTGSTSEPENMKKIDGKSFYVITTADELAWFASQVNSGKTTINAVLANHIVFGKDNSTRCPTKWTPIGKDPSHKFGGILDGAGYTIYGIYVDSIPVAGIIGVLETGGVVRNLRTNTGYIRGSFRVGGFVAHNDGTIQSAENNNRIEGFYKDSSDTTSIYVGGIAGHNNGMIATSSNKMPVNNKAPTSLSGGIAGKNSGQIYNSGNSGSVSAIIYKTGARYEAGTSDGIYSGGIAGHNTGSINRIRNIGNVSADGYIVYYKDLCVGCNIEQSHDVYRKTYSGGIVGLSSTTISNAINNGKISNSNKKNRYINGIVASGKAKNSIDQQSLKYWLNETEIQGTAENMQKDQFAWILNTTNGTEINSGIWTRTTGYPDFAKDSNLPIYRVVFNDDGATSNRYTNYKGLATFPENPEPAEGLVFKGWYNSEDIRVKPTTVFSSDQTVNAVYMNATDIYWTINFFNTDVNSTLLETKQYQHGSIVAYEGETPTKETTAKYTYTFKGWNVEPTNAVEDFDYYAVYDSTIRSYTIIFKDYDGSEISSSAFEYGTIPSCSKTPSRTATAKWTYAHKGWKPALDYVTESTEYTATYDSTKVEYKVTFMNGVDIIDEQMVPYGDAATAPTNVTREGYRFTGWNTSFSKVTENLTVKALFEELVTYIVKVLDGDGTKIDSVKIVEGESYTLPTAPKKDGYTFDAYYNGKTMLGIAGDAIPVVANITITAVYTKDPESSSSSVVKSSSSSAKSSSSSQTKSSSSQARSSSSSAPKETVISGKLEQTLGVYDWMDFIIFSGVQNYSRMSFNIPFLEITESGSTLTIFGTVPGTYRDLVCNGDKKTDSLKVNGRIYKIELTIKNPNKPCNSAVTLASAKKQFSVKTYNRNLLISAAKVGESYAIFDLQGRVLKRGRVESVNFNIPVTLAGNYVVKIGHITQLVQIR
jgi:hypothetical protein